MSKGGRWHRRQILTHLDSHSSSLPVSDVIKDKEIVVPLLCGGLRLITGKGGAKGPTVTLKFAVHGAGEFV